MIWILLACALLVLYVTARLTFTDYEFPDIEDIYLDETSHERNESSETYPKPAV
jgi:hypothetical protein